MSEKHAVETRGIEPVPDSERHGRVRELFHTWFAANISVLLLTMGAGLIVFNGLNLWQVLLVALCAAVVSYGIVGLLTVSGKWGGAPAMTLSRSVFGTRGNLVPGAVTWVARFGWETVNAVTGAYALLSVLDLLFGIRSNTALIVVTLLLFVGTTFLVSGLGRNALLWCNRWSAYLFGIFSVLVLGYLVATVDWSAVFSRPSGTTAMVIAGIGTIAAGGLSWAPSGADFARYLPRGTRSRGIVGTAIGGAGVVVVPMVLMGAVMAVGTPDLATASDPVSFIGDLLPIWLAVPYLLIALVGMVLINSLSMYSAGFTAQTMGVKLPRAWAVSINAVISLVGGLLLMLVATSFYGSFITFLTILAVSFSAWIGVYGADMLRRYRGGRHRQGRTRYDEAALLDTTPRSAYWFKGGFCWQALTAWVLAIGTGLMFTRAALSPTDVWFAGPWADSWIGRNGLAWVVTIVVGALVYSLLPQASTGAVETEPEPEQPHALIPS
ncbi:purine-cytosine permease-like protein [Kitasatospora gansuensis]|uniref:Purine-cytosine permease-like protein n=1 Tax=Kitasatospora gansuensis TaxID=258050 RepID=A0A7W7WGE0_9ACTN|nr:cytosine permease [Kitasatospora gansuensis]MBB4946707.1 purine-cytosine permease-like protein [Kitasatospora gansuensis]